MKKIIGEKKFYKFCPNCQTRLATKLIEKNKYLACPNCSFIFWHNPKPVTSIVLENKEGQILMLQRALQPLKGYWCLPGGFIDYEEIPEQAVKREVQEEAGVDCDITKLIGVYRIDNDPRGIHL